MGTKRPPQTGVDDLCPAELRRNLQLLSARHDHIARGHAKVPVLTAAALDHIDGADRQALRQIANWTIDRQAHDTLQVAVATRTGGGSALFPGIHDARANAVDCSG